MTFAALAFSVVSLVLSAITVGITYGRARIAGRELDEKGRARIAISIRGVERVGDGWTVSLTLTNVGRAHARRVEIWFEDETKEEVSRRHPVGEVLAGRPGVDVAPHIPHVAGLQAVTPVRAWRDDRGGDSRDPSEQTIELP